MFGPCYCRLPHTSQNSDLKQHAPLSVLFRLRCHCQPSTLTQVSRLKTTGVLEGGRRRGGEDWNTFSHSPKPGAPRLWAAGLELRGGHYLLMGRLWDPRTRQAWGPLSWSSCWKWLIKVFHSADLKGSLTCVSYQRAGKAQTFGRYRLSPRVFRRMFTSTDPYWKWYRKNATGRSVSRHTAHDWVWGQCLLASHSPCLSAEPEWEQRKSLTWLLSIVIWAHY